MTVAAGVYRIPTANDIARLGAAAGPHDEAAKSEMERALADSARTFPTTS